VSAPSTAVIHHFPVWLPQTQTWLHTQLVNLPQEFEPHVVCEYAENLDQFPVPHLHCLFTESRSRYYFENLSRRFGLRIAGGHLAAAIRSCDARIVHSHFGNIAWLDQAVVRRGHAAQVVTFYGYDVHMLPATDRRWPGRYRELFDGAERILCEGPHMREQLISMGCPPQKATVQHLGVDLNRLPYAPRRWRPGEPLRVLLAASFMEKKGLPFGLRALGRLVRDVRLEITILGDANTEPRSRQEKLAILESIETSGLSPYVRLLGYQPYPVLLELAYSQHVFVSPSITAANGDTEGGAPVTLIEMMATGMPVISTDHCDIPEVVRYGIMDWLAPERDVDALEDRLRRLLGRPEDWRTMLDRGRSHIEAEYDAGLQGRRLGAIYREVAGMGASA
jgi:colanic acid/amylovoran biosynthesis glycosyltransferase